MNRFTLGFLAGLAAAWAVLAIWRRVPEFPDLDVDQMDDLDRMVYLGQMPDDEPGTHVRYGI